MLEDAAKNTKEYLESRVKELGDLSDDELRYMAKKAKEEREFVEVKRDEMTKKKYWVT